VSQKRFVRIALAKRCLSCGMYNKGECSQELAALACAREELVKISVERGISLDGKDALTIPMKGGKERARLIPEGFKTKIRGSVTKVHTTEEELCTFLDERSSCWRWSSLLERCSDVVNHDNFQIVISFAGKVATTKLVLGKLEKEEVLPEEALFLERLKLKVKANYAQQKDILRDFLQDAKDRGFELRTQAGSLGPSDEQHIAEFIGEHLCEIKKGL